MSQYRVLIYNKLVGEQHDEEVKNLEPSGIQGRIGNYLSLSHWNLLMT